MIVYLYQRPTDVPAKMRACSMIIPIEPIPIDPETDVMAVAVMIKRKIA